MCAGTAGPVAVTGGSDGRPRRGFEHRAARLAGALDEGEQAARHQDVEAAPDERDQRLPGHVDGQRLDGRRLKLVGRVLRDALQAQHDGAVVGRDGEHAHPAVGEAGDGRLIGLRLARVEVKDVAQRHVVASSRRAA